jgi:ribosome-binding protein aMBF1 (putative translation factor)
MAKRPTFEEFEKRILQDEETRVMVEALRPEFELMIAFIKARKKAKMSQKELAKKLKTKQPTIARFENGAYSKSSVTKLRQVADALGYNLKISLQAKK